MPNDNTVTTVEFDIAKRIDHQVETIAAANPERLPDAASPLVEDYVRKIEGSYDVSRSKADTDNAIDLLYIAYNTTPQKHGEIRVNISQLMGDLIAAQQDSELKMDHAAEQAGRILKSLRTGYRDWRTVMAEDDPADLKLFLTDDMVYMANNIKKKAEAIAKDLTTIADEYQRIIDKTDAASKKAEIKLAEDIKDKEALEAEINANNAQREKLESLVKDLEASIQKYEKMANEYADRADTAEQRAFIMSIVRVGAEMITAAVPAITAGITGAATGGTSLVAAAAMSTAREATTREAATEPDDNTAETIEKKKEVIDAKADKEAGEAKKAEIEKEVKNLEEDKDKVEADEEKSDEVKANEVAAIDERIKTKEEEIAEQEKKIAVATSALNAAKAALESLSGNMKEMSQEQKDQAESLRALQMQMLDKVEKYETAKREQAAELVKITALLKGQKTQQETIELAIKSMNLSIRALKRMREIIVEIAFFFRSFAAFMDTIIASAEEQGEALQEVIDRGSLDNSRFKRRVLTATSEFFVSQAAEWEATQLVSTKFVANFKEGWTVLNRLSGDYLTGDKLTAYLKVAADRIDEIAYQREEAARAKRLSLAEYRARIQSEQDASVA